MTGRTSNLDAAPNYSMYSWPDSSDALEAADFPFGTYRNGTSANIDPYPNVLKYLIAQRTSTDGLESYYETDVCVKTMEDATSMVQQVALLSPHRNEPVYPCFSGAFDIARYSRRISIRPLHASPLNMQVERELDRLFRAATEEQFEVGMESEFAKGLNGLLGFLPFELLRLLRTRLEADSISVELIAESMRWLGELEHEHIREHVVSILVFGLNHTSSVVRDAGALALAELEGRDALPYLERAIEKENVPELCQDMKDLLRSL